MKVKTNLSASELEAVGKGLVKLAKKQRDKDIPLENMAERELMRRAEHVLDVMLQNLQSEVSRILLSNEGQHGEYNDD